MDDLTASLRSHAAQIRADLLGIAPVSRFADLPPEHHPASIFPEVRSVLAVGKRITRGSLRGVEEGTQLHAYQAYGRDWLSNRVLAVTTYKVAEFLEDNGWEAVPLPHLPAEIPPLGIPVRPGQPAPNVMLDVEEVVARTGVAERGRCGFLLTPRFGPRQRWQLILTDAELVPDPLPAPAVCLQCDDLAAVCPLGALEPLDLARCRDCQNGASPNNLHPSGPAERLAALCARTCVERLEQAGRLTATFEHPFRRRPPWGVIQERRVL